MDALEFLAIAGALNIIATAIVNLTPTPRDNQILAQVYKAVEWMAGIFTKRAKE